MASMYSMAWSGRWPVSWRRSSFSQTESESWKRQCFSAESRMSGVRPSLSQKSRYSSSAHSPNSAEQRMSLASARSFRRARWLRLVGCRCGWGAEALGRLVGRLNGWRSRHGGSGVTLSVMSVCVGTVEVVGLELYLACVLRGRRCRRYRTRPKITTGPNPESSCFLTGLKKKEIFEGFQTKAKSWTPEKKLGKVRDQPWPWPD